MGGPSILGLPLPVIFAVEVLNIGGWLAHGDLALDASVDFLAVVERRLIPARVRSEWAWLKTKGLASVPAPASRGSSRVGCAWVGIISMMVAPLSLLPSPRGLPDRGRVVRFLLPLGAGRFMHLVVLYGYQGADADPGRLALTDQFWDAALGELSVVARDSPVCWSVISTWSPPESLAWQKGFRLEVSSALATGKHPASTYKRAWGSSGGNRRDFMVGCPLAAAAVVSCTVQADRWIAPHLAVRTL